MRHIVAFGELQHLKQKQVSVRGSLENNASNFPQEKYKNVGKFISKILSRNRYLNPGLDNV